MLRNGFALMQVMRDAKRPRPQLEQLVRRRLKTVFASAYQHVPYYRQRMQEVGYDPIAGYSGPEDLKKLPVVRKAELKERGLREFIKEGEFENLHGYFSDSTCGSTGIPFTVYRYPHERAIQIAKWLRVLFLNGYSVRDRVMSFTSRSRLEEGRSVLQKLGIFRRCPVDNTRPPEKLADMLMDYHPDVVYGARSTIELVALELERRAAKPDFVKLLMVGGDTIYESTRQLCREQYGIELTEMYGSVEMGVMAYQLPGQKGMHLAEDLTYFEFLDGDGNAAAPGEKARIVVTDLTGKLMPFIRYDHGDQGIYREEEGPTGSRKLYLERVVGREDDYLLLPDGTKRTFDEFYEAMLGYQQIRQFRVVQKKVNFFQLYVAADPQYLESIRDALTARLQQSFARGLDFEIVRVDRLEADPNGKIRMFISEVASH